MACIGCMPWRSIRLQRPSNHGSHPTCLTKMHPTTSFTPPRHLIAIIRMSQSLAKTPILASPLSPPPFAVCFRMRHIDPLSQVAKVVCLFTSTQLRSSKRFDILSCIRSLSRSITTSHTAFGFKAILWTCSPNHGLSATYPTWTQAFDCF